MSTAKVTTSFPSQSVKENMNDLLTEAKQIIDHNRSDEPARDLLTAEQRELVTADYASRNEFLSASHFALTAEQRQELERLFWEHIKRKDN
jgi:ABC-type transporter MlaC component